MSLAPRFGSASQLLGLAVMVFFGIGALQRTRRRRNKKGRELNAPPTRGTAKRLCREIRQAAPLRGAYSVGLCTMKIRGFLVRP